MQTVVNILFQIFMKSIQSQRIKELRGSLNQQEFADKIGLSRVSLSSLENGKSSLSMDTAEKIKKVYQVSLDWLFGYSEDQIATDRLYKEIEDKDLVIAQLRKDLEICNSNNEMLKSLLQR